MFLLSTTQVRISTMIAHGTCTEEDCAGAVLATVVSMPKLERAVIDAGSKALTSDLLDLEGLWACSGISRCTERCS